MDKTREEKIEEMIKKIYSDANNPNTDYFKDLDYKVQFLLNQYDEIVKKII